MYMVFLIEHHILKNENQGQKKQQAFFKKRNHEHLAPVI
jgi:hypothetical protein